MRFFFVMQNPCCLSSEQGQDDFIQESNLSTSGTECCSGINQSKEQRVFHSEEPDVQFAASSWNRLNQKRKTLKDKGTHSILRFFKKWDPSCSSMKEEHADNLQNAEALSSADNSCLELNEASRLTARPLEVDAATNNVQCTSTQFEQRREAWSYKIDEIDPSVVDELPPEIQEEVQSWLRPHKRSNLAKRGSTIAHYFMPTRKT
ncbi:hypothetical protein PanWU01x14_131720 [Parasponia andersonii]|uniref:Uncharacterized protein n=1 Tax=Parasponia andersonii TaxID=3476 RepID=A0A2P5CR29_PARAD|nr:hypothetical protein PanWU01x14_131720 [Parasponia andersonii]